jgi:hypothetical protein
VIESPSNSYHEQDPQDDLPYRWDWTAFLAGDTIAAAIVSADPGIDIRLPVNNDTSAEVWVSGGTIGRSYRVTSSIVTALGLKKDWSKTIHILEQ